ncbi:MAG: hypothetical protein Q9211_000824 [Gyalolechia sp. 1 TL-2023]
MLSDEDIDQDFPLEIDDACITADAVLPMPPGQTSPMAAFNAHISLVKLLAKTVRYDLFEHLPEAAKLGRLNTTPQKKRSEPMKDLAQANTDKTPNMAARKSILRSPTEWTSPSYATEDADRIPSSRAYDSPKVPRHNISNMEQVSIGTPQQAFSSSPQDTSGFQTSSMIARSVPSSSIGPTYSPPNTTGMSGFPDITTMMFPSNDPFAYPNQPMTTLENLQGSNRDLSFAPQLITDRANHESYSNPSAPVYGPLPAYTLQDMRSTSARMDDGSRGFDDGQGWAGQHPQGRFAAPPARSDWDTIFGEDWSGGWTDPGYTQ